MSEIDFYSLTSGVLGLSSRSYPEQCKTNFAMLLLPRHLLVQYYYIKIQSIPCLTHLELIILNIVLHQLLFDGTLFVTVFCGGYKLE